MEINNGYLSNEMGEKFALSGSGSDEDNTPKENKKVTSLGNNGFLIEDYHEEVILHDGCVFSITWEDQSCLYVDLKDADGDNLESSYVDLVDVDDIDFAENPNQLGYAIDDLMTYLLTDDDRKAIELVLHKIEGINIAMKGLFNRVFMYDVILEPLYIIYS